MAAAAASCSHARQLDVQKKYLPRQQMWAVLTKCCINYETGTMNWNELCLFVNVQIETILLPLK